MNDELAVWTPTAMVELARAVTWLLATLILRFNLKSTIADTSTQFFKK